MQGHTENVPTPGRGKKFTLQDCHWLIRETKKDWQQPLRELHNIVAPHCSVRTVKWALAEENIKKW